MKFNQILDWIDRNISELDRDREYYENRKRENPLRDIKTYWQSRINEIDYEISLYEAVRSCVIICRNEMEERHGKR